MVDRYMKVVLTVIAVALVWLCLWGSGPEVGTPAEAQGTTVQAYETMRYDLIPVQSEVKGGGWTCDSYLLDTRDGRVWVWPHRADREFVPIPVREAEPQG